MSVSDIIDALPFYVLLIDENHQILQANRATRTQLGLEPEAIIGQYCPKVIHGLNEPWYACPLEEAVKSGTVVEREALDQGSGRWIRSAVYPTGRYTSDGKRIFFHMVADVTDKKHAEEQLSASREQLLSLSEHLESVRELERKNVAREVHDGLGQLLTAIKFDLAWLTKRLPGDDAPLLQKANSIDELLDNALQTVKTISAELRPSVLDDLGLGPAIQWQGHEFQERTGIKFHFTSRPTDNVLNRDVSTALFRICQEALTNVARHARAKSVTVSLRRVRGNVVLTVCDDGRGITKEQLSDPKSFGLAGMRERARRCGGNLAVRLSPGRGTIVTVSVPEAGRRDDSC